jgi:hypothetical protein
VRGVYASTARLFVRSRLQDRHQPRGFASHQVGQRADIFDHELLAEMTAENVGDNPAGDIGRAPAANG